MNQNQLISVIVPVYKVEDYLQQCIDSILNQTYRNLEIILVDDGSPDRCPEICDQYASFDKRVKVIHQENSGAADARNAGLDVARGNYIGFVDWIVPDMYENMLSTALDYDAEIVCCGFTYVGGENDSRSLLFGHRRKTIGHEMFRDVLDQGFVNLGCVNKLYRAQLLKNIRFPCGELYEDFLFTTQTMGSIQTGAFTGEAYYYYRNRPESLTNGDSLYTKTTVITKHVNTIEQFIDKNYPELRPSFLNFKMDTVMVLLYRYYESECSENMYRDELIGLLKQNLPFILQSRAFSFKKRCEALLMCIGIYKPAQRLWRIALRKNAAGT